MGYNRATVDLLLRTSLLLKPMIISYF